LLKIPTTATALSIAKSKEALLPVPVVLSTQEPDGVYGTTEIDSMAIATKTNCLVQYPSAGCHNLYLNDLQ
jgi:hypothetical protein